MNFGILRVAFLFLLVVNLLSCASMRGRRQTLRLACSTPQCEVFDIDRASLGKAPSLIKVPRQKKTILHFSNGHQEQELELSGHFRWLDSFAANAMLSTIAGPVALLAGLTTDFYTGAAWNYENPNTISLSDTKSSLPPPKAIAIAPPQTDSELFSDLIGRQLQNALRDRYSESQVLDYDSTLPQFQRSNYTYDHPFDSEVMLIKTLEKVPISHYAESKVEANEQEIIATVTLNDAFRPDKTESFKLSWPKSHVKNSDTVTASYWRSKIIELLPNSLGLTNSAFFGAGSAFELTSSATPNYFYNLDYIYNSDLIAGRLGFTATNIRPDFEDRFQYVFRWAADTHFFRSQYHITRTKYNPNQISAIETLGKVGIYNLGLGIGPEVGIGGQFGYVYMNLIPTIGTYFADYFGESKNEFLGNSELTLNLGYLSEIRNQWYFRMNIGVNTASNSRISHIIEQYTNSPISNAFLTQSKVSFSVEYYLPEIRNLLKNKGFDIFK